MISKEEYKILLHCKDKPQEQEKGKGEEYATLAFDQLLFRMEQGPHTIYKTTYHGKKAIEEYLSARKQIRVSNCNTRRYRNRFAFPLLMIFPFSSLSSRKSWYFFQNR